jgi:hypothetical protein
MNAEWGNKSCLHQPDSATKMDFSENDLGGLTVARMGHVLLCLSVLFLASESGLEEG